MKRQINLITFGMFKGFRGRIFWTVTPLISLLALVLLFTTIYQAQHFLEQQLKEQGISLVKGLATHSELPLLTDQQDFINLLGDIATEAPEFLFAQVYRKDHSLLSDTGSNGANKSIHLSQNIAQHIHASKTPFIEEVTTPDERYYQFWIGVNSSSQFNGDALMLDDSPSPFAQEELIGYATIALSLRSVNSAKQAAVTTGAVVFIFFLLLCSIIIYYLSEKITQPIQQLVSLSEAVTQGDLNQHFDFKRDDELGKLADAFNRMITAIQHRNQELENAHDSLERRVNERTQELLRINASLKSEISERKRAEQSLELKSNELERSNKELDQFAYVASHDLKAPLRAIANLSSWIAEDLGDDVPEEVQSHINLLQGRVQRMEALINGVLEWSRVGRIKTEWGEVNINKLLEDIIDSMPVPEGFQINIINVMPTLTTAPVRLSQVFSNIISNAIKYSDKGPDGQVDIEVKDKGEYYEFSLTDNGPGIAPEFHEKVFTIFQTLVPKDTRESTGVGLSLVKKIVEEQQGEIQLESDTGQGACFRFTWPKVAHISPGNKDSNS